MPLDVEQGKKLLQLLTSRYDDRHWRKKIEKTLSFPATGIGDETQREIFLYLKRALKAYKSRRADPDSWIVGGFATREAIERAKFNPTVVAPAVPKDDVMFLGEDPGSEIDQDWWEEMLVWWFEGPEEESTAESGEAQDGSEAASDDSEPAEPTASSQHGERPD